jgi:uncharacterized membrane protein YpjA
MSAGVGRRIDAFVARYFDHPIPESRDLPRYVAPLPEWLEDVGLRLAWPIVIVNLLGTAFGFWYYSVQLAQTPLLMWPIVPVSPLATMYMGLSLAAWRLGYRAEWLHMLAFFGCLKYGLWTPFVQVFLNGPGGIELWLYQFLIWSHFAMGVQAFLIQRYADFPVRAVGLATGWFVLNDILDYFVAVLGGPHHTWIRALAVPGGFDRTLPAFRHAAGAAVTLTVLAVFLARATRVALLRRRAGRGSDPA